MMKKRITALFLLAVICVLTAMPAFAMGESSNLVDGANLLTDLEERSLTQKLEDVSAQYDVDVVIVTTLSVGNMSLERYSEQFGVGDGKDAVVLLISMEDRDSAITASGTGKSAIGDSEIDDILDAMNSDLRSGDYADAFETYIDECNFYLDIEINGEPFGSVALTYLGVSLVIGLVVALIVTGILCAQLKSVRAKASASDYVKSGSMNVTLAQDMFLYRKVDRRAKPKSSSSGGSSSSGNSHGSRKF